MAVRIHLTCPEQTLVIQKYYLMCFTVKIVCRKTICLCNVCFSNYWKQTVICVTRFMTRNGLLFYIP